MLKGVNHQIIEIRQTDDPYFERALLFVRADYAEKPTEELWQRGERLLQNGADFTGLRHNRALCWFKRCALLLSGGIGGVILGAFLIRWG